jgi:hypothetical protein
VLGINPLEVRDEDGEVSIDAIVDLVDTLSSPRWIPGRGPPYRVDFREPLLES